MIAGDQLQRVFPVETLADRALSASRRYQALFGYPPGRVEDWIFQHRATFTPPPLTAGGIPMLQTAEGYVDTHVYSIPMGGLADFEWQAIGLMFNAGATPDLRTGEIGDPNPGDMVDIAFFSENGTRPHQSEPIRMALYRGTGTNQALDTSFALPFCLVEPTFISRNDVIRLETTNRLDFDQVTFGALPLFVDVALIGVRFYPDRS